MMIGRTNEKLGKSGAGIELGLTSYKAIPDPPNDPDPNDPRRRGLAYVNQDEYEDNVKELLKHGVGMVRIFLVKYAFDAGHDAFAYASGGDPYEEAISVTVRYNSNSDDV